MKRLCTYALMSFLFVAGSFSLQASSLGEYAEWTWQKTKEAAAWAKENPGKAFAIAALVAADPIAKHKYNQPHGLVGYAHEWLYCAVANTLGLAIYTGAKWGKSVSEAILSMWEEPGKAAAAAQAAAQAAAEAAAQAAAKAATKR